jgi:uncharacterized membrane protein YphA (DoxX/SURF4 family)
MTKSIPPAFGVIARVIVGAVLVYAGAVKAAGPSEEFALVIGSYDVLPRDMVQSMAVFLPWIELVIGWALILGVQLRAAAAAAGLLFGGFLAALIMVQLKGIELPNCGCLGDAIHFTPLQATLFDSCLVALSWLSWKSAPHTLSLDSWAEGGYTGRQHGQR